MLARAAWQAGPMGVGPSERAPMELGGPPAASDEGKLAWSGRVIDGVFRGPRRTLTVEAAGLRFTVECPATRAAGVGENVKLLVDAESLWAIQP